MAAFDAFGLVVSELAASLAFYRRLGVDLPEGGVTSKGLSPAGFA